MSLQRDWILRIVEQLAHALARAAGLRARGEHEQAVREVEGAARGLAGIDLHMAATVDPATLARLVAEPPRLAALARLMWERAAIAADAADAATAGTWRARAVAVWREAAARGAELDETARAALASA